MLKGVTSTCLVAVLVSLVFSGCDGPQKSPSIPPPAVPPASVTPPAKPEEKKPLEVPKVEVKAEVKADLKPEIKAEAKPEAKPAISVETPKPAETPVAKPAEVVPTKPEEKKATETVTPPQPTPAPTPPAAAPAAPAAAAVAGAPHPALLNPALANEKAPEKFKAKFTTTKGDFVIEVTRAWSPNGADRFYNMVKIGYLNDVAFFRNIQGFMVQFGINGDPKVNEKWRNANIKDDPVVGSNLPGYVTFAQSSAVNSRTTQMFINFGSNTRLDGMRFAPFGQIVEGMNVVQALYNVYGEGAPGGRGPRQDLVQTQGNAYLKESFPLLDYVKTATIAN